MKYSAIGNVALFGMFVLNVKNIVYKNLFSFIQTSVLIWLTLLMIYSVTQGKESSLVLRFALILVFSLFAYYIKIPNVINIFYFFILAQCVFLIIFEIILLLFYDADSYLSVRHYSLQEMKWGDIWRSDGYYKIQVKGNALIPFAYMLSYTKFVNFKYEKLTKLLLFAGIIFAGNFAFLISIFLFHLIIFFNVKLKKRLYKKIAFFAIISMISVVPVYSYVKYVIDAKSEMSLSTRWDQFNVLMTDLEKTSLFFGSGLGNTINVATRYRDYSNEIYYELQSLYLLNQMGVFNFIVFVGFHILFALSFINHKKLLFIYFMYVVYAVTNPYIFDTNHIIVIIVLMSLARFKNENSLHHSSL
jgi:hypothetical protein